jgi:hypothetical protein
MQPRADVRLRLSDRLAHRHQVAGFHECRRGQPGVLIQGENDFRRRRRNAQLRRGSSLVPIELQAAAYV